MFEITLEESFSAAHALRGYQGKCERVHGHNYRVRVSLQAEQLDPAGLVMDFVDVRALLRDLLEPFDHRLLNDVPPFDTLNPTAENMARHFFVGLSRRISAQGPRVRVAEVRVWETEAATAAYRE
ncbi:MAG: 6-carboxytetrahydropterin synthase QueD [Acidobacteria bacterium]|nr:6-carboxytetrahydropterin synthase QueD [Acidobacteriota bacterium]